MASEESRLRQALVDPAAWLVDETRARAEYALRCHALERLSQALAPSGAEALLVKGAALALTHYPRPWQREMTDIDLVARPGERDRLLAALERAGCQKEPPPAGRFWSSEALGETALILSEGALSVRVELHSRLDKLVGRPVPYAAVFARARREPGLLGLRLPSAEDHALLVALHCASSDYLHPPGFIDLELLLRRGLDGALLEARARRWRLCTALYVALQALRTLEAPSVSDELVERFRPARWRRWALSRSYRLGRYPVTPQAPRPGWRWTMRQSALRDDTARWLGGLTSYAAKRAVERALRR